jgi:hypothetical protein
LVGVGLVMDYVKKLLWGIVQTLSVFCFMAALIVYDYVKDTPWILGYVYAKTSLIFAGIENKEFYLSAFFFFDSVV